VHLAVQARRSSLFVFFYPSVERVYHDGCNHHCRRPTIRITVTRARPARSLSIYHTAITSSVSRSVYIRYSRLIIAFYDTLALLDIYISIAFEYLEIAYASHYRRVVLTRLYRVIVCLIPPSAARAPPASPAASRYSRTLLFGQAPSYFQHHRFPGDYIKFTDIK
jgi:hypothetical protein